MDAYSGDLAFLPLGGTGEIGMNLNLYRCAGKWLAVDCGIGFGGGENPEVEIMVPDPTFIAERRDDLLALVITHAHEDHVGAVAHLWRRLRCPVYATPFASAVLRRKLTEAGLQNEVRLHVLQPGAAFELGPFALQFVPVTHSIPEAQALILRTKYGVVLQHRRLEAGPQPADRQARGRGGVQATGRGRRSGDGVRQHQCPGRGPFRVRGRRAPWPVGAYPPVARPGRRDLLRQQRGPGREHRLGGAGRRAHGGAGRAVAAQPGRRGAGLRLPARHPRIPPGGGTRATCRTTTC